MNYYDRNQPHNDHHPNTDEMNRRNDYLVSTKIDEDQSQSISSPRPQSQRTIHAGNDS